MPPGDTLSMALQDLSRSPRKPQSRIPTLGGIIGAVLVHRMLVRWVRNIWHDSDCFEMRGECPFHAGNTHVHSGGKAGLNLFLCRAVTRKREMPRPRADWVRVWDVCPRRSANLLRHSHVHLLLPSKAGCQVCGVIVQLPWSPRQIHGRTEYMAYYNWCQIFSLLLLFIAKVRFLANNESS